MPSIAHAQDDHSDQIYAVLPEVPSDGALVAFGACDSAPCAFTSSLKFVDTATGEALAGHVELGLLNDAWKSGFSGNLYFVPHAPMPVGAVYRATYPGLAEEFEVRVVLPVPYDAKALRYSAEFSASMHIGQPFCCPDLSGRPKTPCTQGAAGTHLVLTVYVRSSELIMISQREYRFSAWPASAPAQRKDSKPAQFMRNALDGSLRSAGSFTWEAPVDSSYCWSVSSRARATQDFSEDATGCTEQTPTIAGSDARPSQTDIDAFLASCDDQAADITIQDAGPSKSQPDAATAGVREAATAASRDDGCQLASNPQGSLALALLALLIRRRSSR